LLLELRVKDLGIIEDINWRLGNGLNVITGETGAGKSLVINAVEALLAGKAEDDVIRHGMDEAQIEAVFALPQTEAFTQLRKLLEEKGLQTIEDTLIINCGLRRQARGIVRVNGYAVPRGLLQQVGRLLIDIHGQSEHLSLINNKYHLDFLDAFAHTQNLRQSFSVKATELYRVEQEIKALVEDTEEQARRQEFLSYQVNEITQAKLKEGETDELESERNILASTEKLKSLAYEVYKALRGDDDSHNSISTLGKLSDALQMMKSIVDLDPTVKQQLSFLEETFFGLEEVTRDIYTYSDGLEYNPKRLEEIEWRLECIRSLQRKYGQTISEVLDYLQKAEMELEGLSHHSERQVQLEESRSSLRKEMGYMAAELSQARHQAAKQLVMQVKKELYDLNMAEVEFEVSATKTQAQEGISLPDGQTYLFNNEGIDTVEFYVSTNPGEPLKPLAKIASTGEISRFTLALKGALSEADSIPVLIFDEIDIGIGGRSGEIIGKKLWILAQNHQVICVTHLPQIAAFADAHFSIHKITSGDRTLSILETLQGESRTKELAVMLAGTKPSEASLTHAHELTQKAEIWKSSHHLGI
jgi:DNA repair protein RecN (Recombination protein N)